MAIGAPDWQGLKWKTETTNRPRQIWPSGKVVWSYDFETPWAGINVSAGTITYEIIAGYGNSGGNSLRLTSSAVAGTTGTVYRHFGPVALGKYGLEATFATDPNLRNTIFGFQVVDDDATYDAAGIRLIAQLPTMIAAFDRLRNGKEVLPPRSDL
ncbi:hypothetical protein LCGC14_0900850, partial [marine sediment metagenome]